MKAIVYTERTHLVLIRLPRRQRKRVALLPLDDLVSDLAAPLAIDDVIHGASCLLNARRRVTGTDTLTLRSDRFRNLLTLLSRVLARVPRTSVRFGQVGVEARLHVLPWEQDVALGSVLSGVSRLSVVLHEVDWEVLE
jgi:hypothetical protein